MSMEDLIPVRTKDEAKERGRNGGIASGKVRRRKRAMKEATKLLLDMPLTNQSMEEDLKAMGFPEKELTNQMALIVSMWKEALKGNVRAAEFLRDTAGENASHKQHVEEFEYKKEKDAGFAFEIEDLDDIEEEIYGSQEADQGVSVKEPVEKENDPV